MMSSLLARRAEACHDDGVKTQDRTAKTRNSYVLESQKVSSLYKQNSDLLWEVLAKLFDIFRM